MTAATQSRPVAWMVGRVGALVLVGLVLAELTDNVFDHDGLTVVDRPWHQWIVAHRSPVLTQLANGVSTLGSTTVLAVLAGCVAAWLAWRRQWAQAILVGVTTGGAGLLVPLAKNVVGRPRPPVADRLMVETSWSYPSGHSLGAAAVVGVLTVVLVSRLAGRAVRAVVIAAGVLIVVAIGLSRVYLGVHWPSDVLAGWLLGGLWLAICCALTSRWQVANRPLPTLDPTDQGQRDQGERGES